MFEHPTLPLESKDILLHKSDFEKERKFIKKHCKLPWKDWFSIEKMFKRGKQGVVGVMELQNKKRNKCVFKISQFINYLAYHEFVIMCGLESIKDFCPHFCRAITIFESQTEPAVDAENPFELASKYAIEKDVLVIEYIDDSCKMYNFIRSKNIDDNVIFSIIKQTLLALQIAQQECQFTHYDLHSFNVMIKQCSKDAVFLYRVRVGGSDSEPIYKLHHIPTYGYFPVIIDFGFSFVGEMNDGPLWPSLAHTNVGFMSDRFDPVADAKLFLMTVSDEMKSKRGSKASKLFRNVVRNIYFPLKIDIESGWDTVEEYGASDTILMRMDSISENFETTLFSKYSHYCIDLLQSLIILPIQPGPGNTNKLDQSFSSFLKEWIKIEHEISSPFYNMFILKGLVDCAREIRSQYMSKNESESRAAVAAFRAQAHTVISKVAKYCAPKNVNFEVLLCSMLAFSNASESILHNVIAKTVKRKDGEYAKMPVKTTDGIFEVIDSNFPCEYEFNENTVVYFFDSKRKHSFSYQPDLAALKNDSVVEDWLYKCARKSSNEKKTT
jgi:hypothetical protein